MYVSVLAVHIKDDRQSKVVVTQSATEMGLRKDGCHHVYHMDSYFFFSAFREIPITNIGDPMSYSETIRR